MCNLDLSVQEADSDKNSWAGEMIKGKPLYLDNAQAITSSDTRKDAWANSSQSD